MTIIACNDPLGSGRNMYDELVWTLENSKEHHIELFTGFHDDRKTLVKRADEAAKIISELISRHRAEGLVMDVRGFDGTDDYWHFWINAYERLLTLPQFKMQKRRVNVVFWSRHLDGVGEKGMVAMQRLLQLGVPKENILDRNNATPIQVLRRLSANRS